MAGAGGVSSRGTMISGSPQPAEIESLVISSSFTARPASEDRSTTASVQRLGLERASHRTRGPGPRSTRVRTVKRVPMSPP